MTDINLAFTRRISTPLVRFTRRAKDSPSAITRTRRCASRFHGWPAPLDLRRRKWAKSPTRSNFCRRPRPGGHSPRGRFCPQLIPAAKHIPHGNTIVVADVGEAMFGAADLLISRAHPSSLRRLITPRWALPCGGLGAKSPIQIRGHWCWWAMARFTYGDGTGDHRPLQAESGVSCSTIAVTARTQHAGRAYNDVWPGASARLPKFWALGTAFWSKPRRIGRCAGKGRAFDRQLLFDRSPIATDGRSPRSTAWPRACPAVVRRGMEEGRVEGMIYRHPSSGR